MTASVQISPGWPADSRWSNVLASVFQQPYFRTLQEYIAQERQHATVFPAEENVFNAFRLTDFDSVKVVILGQDPYHGAGQAHGLSFSVPADQRHPPSLRNIFKELQSDLNCPPPMSGCLESWAKQGVFLLNTVLTVRESQANSHRKQGWETFTDEVIRQLNAHPQPLVFILWGKPAQTKSQLIDDRHAIIASPHPSPLAAYRGFFGSRPFTRSNAALAHAGTDPVDWQSICQTP